MAKVDSAFRARRRFTTPPSAGAFPNPRMKALYDTHRCRKPPTTWPPNSPSRADQDAFVWRSQQRWVAADAAGRFADELIPLRIPQKKASLATVTRDEHPRPDTTLEQLARLKGVNGPELSVTAGNSSGVNDGACALLLALAAAAQRHGLTCWRGWWAWLPGVPPRIMGLWPSSRR